MINLIAIRQVDDETCGCSGCGKDCKVSYQIIGRHDLKEDETNFALYLCYQCYRPIMKVIETRGAKS